MCPLSLVDGASVLAEGGEGSGRRGSTQREGRRDRGAPASTMLLRLGRVGAQATETVKADFAGECVASFLLVELRRPLPSQEDCSSQSSKQRALGAANFAQCQRQSG